MFKLGNQSITVISIHALLAESDRYLFDTMQVVIVISIHALLAESDNCTSIGRPKRLYFYPRSPCGERRASNQTERQEQHISIHALLAESDPDTSSTQFRL